MVPSLARWLALLACSTGACGPVEVREYDRSAVWSDDDSIIVIVREWADFSGSETNERHAFFLWDPDTDDQQQLGGGPYYDDLPQIYAMVDAGYLLAVHGGVSGAVTRIDLASEELRDAVLPMEQYYSLVAAVPSPDGRRIAVLRDRFEGIHEVSVIDDQLAAVGPPVTLPGLDWDLTWTPEGQLIVHQLGEAARLVSDGAMGAFDGPFCTEPRTSSSSVSEDHIEIAVQYPSGELGLVPTTLPAFGDDCATR